MFCWGAGGAGQLANGNFDDAVLFPVAIELPEFDEICGGGSHTIAFKKASKECVVWGNNENRQLCDSCDVNIVIPKVIGLNFKIMSVSLGWDHSLAVDTEGILYGWGSNHYGQLGLGTNYKFNNIQKVAIPCKVKQVDTQFRHTVVLSDNGEIYGFGETRHGQLGLQEFHKSKKKKKKSSVILTPQLLHNCLPDSYDFRNDKIVSIKCGMRHTLFLTASGKAWGLGNNKFGQIGNYDSVSSPCLTAVMVTSPNDIIIEIHCGWNHSVFLCKERKKIILAGRNNYGQLGSRSMHHNELTVETPVKQLAIGSEHCLMLLESGELFVWGWNEHGQLGLSNEDNYFTPATHQNRYSSVFCGTAQCFASLNE